MNTHSFFHHPHVSLTVLRRRIADELTDMLECYGQVLLTGRPSALFNSSCFSSRTAYYSAVSRLRKAGVLAYRHSRDGKPTLSLAPGFHGQNKVPDPRRFWREKWRGFWSVLVYDIPEEERRFRGALRKLLSQHRMGCLQKSVWVSPRDIRPLYNDLQETLRIQFVSHLFDAYSVLGRRDKDIVLSAWDFKRLTHVQSCFLKLCASSMDRLSSGRVAADSLGSLAHDELVAYHTVMRHDPLLPHRLLPHTYLGREVYEQHRAFISACKHAMNTCR